MDVEIREVVATVRAVDGATLASPEVIQRIVAMLLRAVDDRRAHEARVGAERRVTGGVSQERDIQE